MITPALETLIFNAIQRKSNELNSPVLAINGTADHIHVAVSISAAIAAAQWVQWVKGVSAHDVNEQYPDLETRFQWQNSYGILTFGAKNLDDVVDYIKRQKEHHRENTIKPYMERTDD